MRIKIYILGLACILLIACSDKVVGPGVPIDSHKTAPNIVSFTANPTTIELGEKSTLSWEVHDCNVVEIDGGIGLVASTGSIEVSPLETTYYTLTASKYELNSETGTYQTYLGSWSTKTCTVTVAK
jgi:peptidoglycan-associated lipoprotein